MSLTLGNKAIAQVKGGRGLAHDTMAYTARDGLTFVRDDLMSVLDDRDLASTISVLMFGQPVTAGQETPVSVSVAGLRANADVKRMKATLRVLEDAAAEPAPNRLSVQEGEGEPREFVVSAQGPPGLSNVTLRLDPGEVFWTHAGVLAPGDHEIEVDFAEQVNAYLDQTVHAGGAVTLKFMIKSDTPGRVLVLIEERDYAFTLLQTQTWPNDLDGTLRADRNLALDFNTVVRLPLTAITPEGGHAPALARISMDVSGQFGPERLLESTAGLSAAEGASSGEFCTVSNEYSLARGFVLDPVTVKGGAIQCAGFSAYVRVTEEAEIYAELQVDQTPTTAASGTPAGGAALPAALPALTIPATGSPLAKANQVIAPPPEAEGQPSERWVSVRWEAPAEIQVGVPYWLVLKGIRGKAYLGLRSGDGAPPQAGASGGRAVREERLRINRGGQLWKGLQRGVDDQIRARLALVYTPGPDNGVAAVRLSVEGAAAVGATAALADPGAQAETVALDLGGAAISNAVLVVQSSASGAFTLANVIQEYGQA